LASALALVTAAGTILAAGPGAWDASAEAAQVLTYLINTAEAGGPDSSPGDGVCTTAPGTNNCSLLAAIQESNATKSQDAEVFIGVAKDFKGTISMPDKKDLWMTDVHPTGVDSGAYFYVTRTVTIDLDERLSVVPASNDGAAAFWIEAENVKLRNFKNVYSGETAIIFGPGSDGSSLDGGSLIQTDNWRGERLAFIRPGADGVSISNFTVSRLYDGSERFGAIVVRKSTKDSEDVVSDLRFSNVTIDNAPAPVSKPDCSSSDGSGCSSSGIVVSKIKVQGMVVEGSEFRNFPLKSTDRRRAIDLYEALECSDIDIRDNTFTNILTGANDQEYATVLLPNQRQLTGKNYVRGNTFDNSGAAAGGQAVAIGWEGDVSSANSTQASNLYIEDNHFDGYARATVALVDTGAVTVRRNTFGTATASASPTENEETWGWSSGHTLMVLNDDDTANRRILTWYPVATRVTSGCEFQVDVSKPAAKQGYGLPNDPVTIDFYYTVGQTAEVYLGSVSGVTPGANGARTVAVPEFPPSDAGYVRVQTQGEPASGQSQVESSQYSRTLPLPSFGLCRQPKLNLQVRAWQQADPGPEPDQGLIHDSVIATGRLIDPGSPITSGLAIWFTYTVSNLGHVPLLDVEVTDGLNQQVCVIAVIPKGASAGCAKPHTAP
jgi:adhesin/invasin